MRTFPGGVHPDYPVATIYTWAGRPHDYVGDHEPARSYAAAGYRVEVHSGDGPYSRDELQELVDRELRDAVDRFGPGHRK
ncbi:hypothetical protein [Mycolicibacterium sp.]|uniref:hypothetical protein n=1 Tax=Mycolicibacterium sp. TaxID=2320850 RepID=UPI00356062BA